LAGDGHEILAVVAERASTLASLREWLWKFGPRVFIEKSARKLLRLAGLKRSPQGGAGERPETPMRQVAMPPVYFVDSHNSEECVELVYSLRPDALVLRGCGILKRPILATAWLGAINPHYATLPAYRGMDVTEWAALHGDPVAVSVHFVTEHVDTGAVIVSGQIPVEPGDTTGKLRDKSAALAVELLAEALNKLEAGVAGQTASPGAVGRQYFAMHPRLRRLADLRLKGL
jgi:methionyl-tRNA formyltransferase